MMCRSSAMFDVGGNQSFVVPDAPRTIEAISARVTNNVKGSGGMTNDALEDIKLYWQRRGIWQNHGARNHIIKSFCPQIYGLYAVKLALALVLTGGNTMTTNDGLIARRFPHAASR